MTTKKSAGVRPPPSPRDSRRRKAPSVLEDDPGWMITGNVLHLMPLKDGSYRFKSVLEMCWYIYEEALKGSQIHIDAYLGSTWNTSDFQMAAAQGWIKTKEGVAATSTSTPFQTAEETMRWVSEQADKGNLLAKKVVVILAKTKMGAHNRTVFNYGAD